MPVTSPVVFTVANVVLLLLHTPPLTASVRVMVLPAHTADGPLMVPADVAGLTVNVVPEADVPQLLVTL